MSGLPKLNKFHFESYHLAANELRSNLKLDACKDEVRRTVEVETDEPGMGRVDEHLHVTPGHELIGDFDREGKVLGEILVDDIIDETFESHICANMPIENHYLML